MSVGLINFAYIVASILFIYGLKMLGKLEQARMGNVVSAVGMLIAIVATLLRAGMSYEWILAGVIIGAGIGAISAYVVPMTAMPQMVGIFNGFGGLASLLVAWADYLAYPDSSTFTIVAVVFTVVIGGVTFSGSMIAYMKLAEHVISGKPILFRGQHILNALLLLSTVVLAVMFCRDPQSPTAHAELIAMSILSLILGILVVTPIGGADMPVVICLLNSYSGMAACAAGFVLLNNVLIVAGNLVGASGIILTVIMCKAMNRSVVNVVFGGLGATAGRHVEGSKGEVKAISADDAYLILEAASSVVIVPGYGMAVAQAQHAVSEFGELLQEHGCDVKYAIHPVAGRMPGHMNVLLAEAGVPYEQLVEPQDVNPIMPTVDVVMVIGANDVVNPAARDDKSSPIYGMPIINVDQAKTVFVLKRSMASGFAGIDNALFFNDNTRMLFGDAKASVSTLVSEFKNS